MRNVRRFYIPNAIIFMTSVTHRRRPVFGQDAWGDLLFETMPAVQQIHPFRLVAYVILPDHLHWLMWTPEDVTYSQVMQSIKRNFTLNYEATLGITSSLSLRQERFRDHVIRDEDDLWQHFDYVHYNRVKHKLVEKPEDWLRSSFRFWLEQGNYETGWGHTEPKHVMDMDLE